MTKIAMPHVVAGCCGAQEFVIYYFRPLVGQKWEIGENLLSLSFISRAYLEDTQRRVEVALKRVMGKEF